MEGTDRRNKLIALLKESGQPLSGSSLAKLLKVSRQVIVQDIALLRAGNKNILSTNKGYLLFEPEGTRDKMQRSIRVCHAETDILDELYTIVDLGGEILDVVVEHEIYGQITVDLIIRSRRDAKEFYDKIKQSGTRPLNALTAGIHYHTIAASTGKILDDIEYSLKEKEYLLSK